MASNMKVILHFYQYLLPAFLALILKTAGQNIMKDKMDKLVFIGEIGQRVTLSCPPVTHPPFSVTWIVDCKNESLEHHHRYRGRVEFLDEKLNVTISRLTEEDFRMYCCKVETITSSTQHRIQLTMRQQPDSTAGQNNMNDKRDELVTIRGEIGLRVTLSCPPVNDPSFSITWIVDCKNESLEHHHRYQGRVEFLGKKLHVIISRLTEEDFRMYCCKVDTPTSSIQYKIQLTMIQQPDSTAGQNIMKDKMDKLVFTGEIGLRVTLSCPPVTHPSFSVTWIVDCKNESLEHHHRYQGRVEFLDEKLHVIISRLTEEDFRMYCCKVETITSSTQHKIQLTMRQQPDSTAGQNIMKDKMDNLVFIGEIGLRVTLSCPSVTHPSFSVTWIVDCKNESLKHHHRYQGRVEFLGGGLNVTISRLTEEDFRMYCCKVETPTSSIQHKINLTMTQQPDSIEENTEDGPDIKTYILHGVIALQTFVILFLLVLVFRRPGRSASTSDADKMVRGEIEYIEAKH